MSSLRKGESLVLLRKGLSGGGAVDKGDAEFVCQAGGKCLYKQRLKQAGIFLIADVEQANAGGGAVDRAAAEGPAMVPHFQHAQAIRR